jgi:ERCC4-type nuclease
MLLVDERIGSKDMLGPLRQQGIPCDSQHLDFGDFQFIGRGIGGKDIYIAIELKRIGGSGKSDLLSSMYGGRFAGHQLGGLKEFDRAWLLTEGIWRSSPDGILETLQGGWKPLTHGRRPVMMSDVESWILSQIIRGGLWYWHCATRNDTVRFLSVLYRWWTSKDLDEHRSHQAIYLPSPDRASLIEPSNFVKSIIGLVDKVGWDKAFAIEDACHGSYRRLGNFSAQELQSIKGVGKVLAERIVSALGEI